MNEGNQHISGYFSLAVVLVFLLILTTLSVFITEIHLGAFTVAGALILASIKGFTVLSYYMHLKFESLFLRLMIAGVFIIFALVIIITFIDYLLR